MSLAAIAFDLGGVLVGVEKARLFEAFPLPKAQVEEAFFADGRFKALNTGRLSQEAFLDEVARRLETSRERVHKAWAAMVEPLPGASELVLELDVPVMTWSNTDPIHADRLRSALPAPLFSPKRAALSFEIGALKPDPGFFEAALARAGLSPAQVFFVDDRADNVAAARALGIDAVRALGPKQAREALRARGLVERNACA